MSKRNSYSPEFKAKVVRELVEGDDSVGVVAARYHINANMLSTWRRQMFDNAEVIFARDREIKAREEAEAEHRKEIDNLNRIIGQLTVERDYLQRSLVDQLDRLGR